jgi:hypothetical protein
MAVPRLSAPAERQSRTTTGTTPRLTRRIPIVLAFSSARWRANRNSHERCKWPVRNLRMLGDKKSGERNPYDLHSLKQELIALPFVSSGRGGFEP